MNATLSNTADSHKWALLVGIADYPNLDARYQLKGCVNDVELMAGVLQDKFGFPTDNITLLKNDQATRDGILLAMDRLVGQTGKDDIVIVHYSGHGSRIIDRKENEPDAYNETIVPYDSGRIDPDPNRDITDDEIYAWLLRLADVTSYVTLIFDSCHSGSINRDGFGASTRWVAPDERRNVKRPPAAVAPRTASGSSRDIGPSGWLPLSERYVLIASCRADEMSSEHHIRQDGTLIHHGALTFFLSQELNQAEPHATYRDIFERTAARVTTEYRHQHPQMEGARDRVLFGVQDIAAMQFVPVKQRRWNRVTLGAGAAHGATVGSRWAVYPQAAKRVVEGTPRSGLVEITGAGAVTCDAKILEEVPDSAIAEGSRAVEETHWHNAMRLVVDTQVPEAYSEPNVQLRAEILGSHFLRLAEQDEPADIRAYIIPSRTETGPRDPVPQLGAVAQPTWAVVGQDGRLVMPLHLVAETDAIRTVCGNLETMAKYRHALALRNPNQNSRLTGKVEFILKRQEANGAWAVAVPEQDSGQIIFTEGECFAFEIINHHTDAVYISVLDFGLTGAISLLHPPPGANEPLAPGRSLQVGMRQGELDPLFMPQNFPFVLEPGEEKPAGGFETFKLIATTYEADFGGLLQSGVRGEEMIKAKGSGTTVFQLLAAALTDASDRVSQWLSGAPADDWTTVERTFFLAAKRPSPTA